MAEEINEIVRRLRSPTSLVFNHHNSPDMSPDEIVNELKDDIPQDIATIALSTPAITSAEQIEAITEFIYEDTLDDQLAVQPSEGDDNLQDFINSQFEHFFNNTNHEIDDAAIDNIVAELLELCIDEDNAFFDFTLILIFLFYFYQFSVF